MKKRTLFIIGSDFKWEEEQLLASAKKLNIPSEFFYAGDVHFRLNEKDTEIWYQGRNRTADFKNGFVILRRARGQLNRVMSIAILARRWHVPCADSVESILSNLNKTHLLLSGPLKKIKHIPTVFLKAGDTCPTTALEKLSFPILLKPGDGRHGEGIRLCKNMQEVCQEVRDYNAKNTKIIDHKKGLGVCANYGIPEDLLFQKYLKIDTEYRIFIVGGKSVGVVEKIRAKGSLVANYAAGARFIPGSLPTEIVKEAVAITVEMGIDICGFDLARVGKNYYFLEANRCPKFKAFSGATGKNVAQKIIEFVIKGK